MPRQSVWFPTEEYQNRARKARELMARDGIDLLFLTGDRNYVYFTGHRPITPEGTIARPNYFILPLEGDPHMMVHVFIEGDASATSWIENLSTYTSLLEAPVKELAEIIRGYNLDGKKIGADFLVGSGHKSFASPAPSGIVATTDEWANRVFRTTQIVGDVTKRRFGIKEVEMMGCTLMGANLIAMMASFPAVQKRVERWDEEVEKINYFVDKFLKIRGNRILSELPRKHTLTKVDTTESFDLVARTHKRRGFFFSDELKERRILGEFPGATRAWKLNTYGLTWDQIRYLAQAFQDIARKHGITVV